MSTIIRRTDRGIRSIDTTQIAITELVWADGGRSFEAHLSDGTDLTEDGCFDEAPTDQQLRNLLHTRAGRWTCPGCHRSIDETQADMVTDHVRDCDLVNGAGHLRRCPCGMTAPVGGPCPLCADTDTAVVSGFDVYRCDPEASYLIPALSDGDPRLEIRIAAVGGGDAGTGYADNHWIYGVWLGGLLVCSGADLRSAGVAHTHRHMAAVLAESLADKTPAPLRPQRERLGQWASDAQNPDETSDHDV